MYKHQQQKYCQILTFLKGDTPYCTYQPYIFVYRDFQQDQIILAGLGGWKGGEVSQN